MGAACKAEDLKPHRTEVLSLAVLICETVAGQLTFKGEAEAAVAHPVLDDEPEPQTAVRTRLPMVLDRAVGKAPINRHVFDLRR